MRSIDREIGARLRSTRQVLGRPPTEATSSAHSCRDSSYRKTCPSGVDLHSLHFRLTGLLAGIELHAGADGANTRAPR
ncbi:hypothetical protein CN217_15980 [Sinorhizobium meliloti]|nr:hypothetical protein CN217_15980 [Sinorhizobium meliloti]